MNFKSVWLIVLTMLMAIAQASAATVNFNGGAVSNCTLSGSTYSCTGGFSMGATDVAAIASGYTVVMAGGFAPSYNQGLSMSGSAVLQSAGGTSLDLSNINPSNVSIGGATLTAGGSFRLGSNITINGSVNAASFVTNSGVTITGSVNVTGLADLGSAIRINGDLTAGSVKTNSPGQVDGDITASTTISIGSGVTVGGNLSGTTITTNSPVTLKGNVSASNAFTLASGSTVTGNISAPTVTLSASSSTVTGSITATGALDIGSGNTVNGAVSAGSLTMRASGATINGATTVSGDVDMGSGSVINGDLRARDVTTHASSAVINGNAAVNSIYIDWGDSVTKTITCTGAGASGCSCVTKADSSYHPTCGAAPPTAPHHFQINHGGTGLTCQPQTVTVTACANAACTTPHFTSNVGVTLQPGGKTFTITGGVNSAATVESKDAGTFTLSASAAGVSNATTCVNSGSGAACDMTFSGTGLTVSATDHVSLAPGALVTLQALTSSPGLPSCVPLISGQTVNINMACSYKNPASGTAQMGIGAKSATCGNGVSGGTVSVPFTFDVNGKASAALQYADVGKVNLSASYATASLSAVGNGDVYIAPAKFLLTAQNAAGATLGPAIPAAMPTGVFAKASEAFTLTVTAVNTNNVATPNFGKESSPSQVKLGATINKSDDTPLPAPVPSGTGNAGALSYPPLAFNAGSSNVSVSFDNVGYVKIVAALDDGSAGSAYYLGRPLSSFQTTGTQYVSRFIPDHFDTALAADTEVSAILPTTHMDCSKALVNPCVSDSTRFVNSGQSFAVKVLAYNGATTPAPATNYAGALAKVIDLTAFTAKGGSTAAAGAITWSGTGTRYTFSSGVGTLSLTGSNDNLPVFTLTTAYPANVAPSNIYLRATDTDGVSSRRSSASSVEAPLAIVSGRLMVGNGFSSQTAPLPVAVTAQYYTPTQGYVYNPLLNGVSPSAVSARFTVSNCRLAQVAVSCPASLKPSDVNATVTLSKGLGKFNLAAPSPPMNGIFRADIQLMNGTQLFPYLPSSVGTETFGLYRSGPVIYTREVF